MYIKNKHSIKHRNGLIVGLVLLLLVAVGVLFIFLNKKSTDNVARTTSTAPTAQSNYTGGNNRQNASSSTMTQGGAVDNSGKTSSTSDQSQWKVSDSGVITLKQPISGGMLKSGNELSGAATLNKVQYRLVDNAVGVIAQGALSVVDGKFSGTLQFSARSKSGSLVIYSFDSQSREVNRIEIPVVLE